MAGNGKGEAFSRCFEIGSVGAPDVTCLIRGFSEVVKTRRIVRPSEVSNKGATIFTIKGPLSDLLEAKVRCALHLR